MISVGRGFTFPASGARHRLTIRRERVHDRPDRKGQKQLLLRLPLIAMEPHHHAIARAATSPSKSAPLILTSDPSGRLKALLSIRILRGLLALVHAFVFLLLAPFRPRWYLSAARSSSASSSMEKEEREEKAAAAVVVRVPGGVVRGRGGRWGVTVDKEVLARRAMAIRRMEDDGDLDGLDEEGRSSARDFALFVSPSRGDTLFTQSWSPVTAPAKGLVVLLHGLNEHSSRYNRFARQLNAEGFKVYAMDWIGHGGSDGLHGYVPSLDFAVNDMKAFLEKVLAENSELPCFCFGHSTGGAIVLKAMLDPQIEALVKGVILTSPAIGIQPAHPLVAVLAPILSILAPKYQFSDEDKTGMPVSRDPKALVAKYSDPLVFTGSIRVRTGSEILRVTSYLQQNLHRVKVPFMVLHGTADTVTDPGASKKLYEKASTDDKSVRLLDGFLHDLLFEPERDDISRDIVEWLSSRAQ